MWRASPLTARLAQTYQTADYSTFNSVLRVFLKEPEVPEAISAACIAVAGPVSKNACIMTNLSWLIDGAEISGHFGFPTQARLVHRCHSPPPRALSRPATTQRGRQRTPRRIEPTAAALDRRC